MYLHVFSVAIFAHILLHTLVPQLQKEAVTDAVRAVASAQKQWKTAKVCGRIVAISFAMLAHSFLWKQSSRACDALLCKSVSCPTQSPARIRRSTSNCPRSTRTRPSNRGEISARAYAEQKYSVQIAFDTSRTRATQLILLAGTGTVLQGHIGPHELHGAHVRTVQSLDAGELARNY